MPTVPSAAVTTLSACCTGMPARTARRSAPRSMWAVPFTTLTSPTSAAAAAAARTERMNAALQRMDGPLWFCDGFYNARDPMAAAVKNTRSAMFPARLGELRHLTAFLEACWTAQAVERSRCLRLNVVLEELFVNSVQPGYRGDCDAPSWITLDVRPEAVQITYEDTAPPFNPFAHLPAPDAHHKVGGLGVLLTRELAAAGRGYAYLFGRNRVRLSLAN